MIVAVSTDRCHAQEKAAQFSWLLWPNSGPLQTVFLSLKEQCLHFQVVSWGTDVAMTWQAWAWWSGKICPQCAGWWMIPGVGIGIKIAWHPIAAFRRLASKCDCQNHVARQGRTMKAFETGSREPWCDSLPSVVFCIWVIGRSEGSEIIWTLWPPECFPNQNEVNQNLRSAAISRRHCA